MPRLREKIYMCGLTGSWSGVPTPAQSLRDQARAMADTLRHRGPDDEGVWCAPATGLALGHRRLSIVDLSPEGRQPMSSAGGRFTIAFNGEIYNHAALRAELSAGDAIAWRGHSDTEVMLAAFERWGVERALGRFVGMFAFALWDAEQHTLHLARDRMGEKPLYIGWADNVLLFASEPKALIAHSRFRRDIDRIAVASYAQLGCIPAPHCIWRDAAKLLPGHLLSVTQAMLGRRVLPPSRPYWSLAQAVDTAIAEPFLGTEDEAVDRLEALLTEAVAGQMVADVPLGAFLSGGVDSSTVVALMQRRSARPVRTFSIGFSEREYDEAPFARAVAHHLGTDHTEVYLSAADAMRSVPRMAQIYDEPFGDSSQIPTLLVSEMARRHVTVSLSGDGGDELFAGYNRHVFGARTWRRLARMPLPLRALLARSLRALPAAGWDSAFGLLRPVLGRGARHRAVGDKLHKLSGLIEADSDARLYERMVRLWPESVALAGGGLPLDWTERQVPAGLDSVPARMMFFDALGYLPDDILVKVDRAAMSTSLETRVPFLDHRVVEYAWRLPLSMKLGGGSGKRILRQLLYRYVPARLIERPKMGFSMPIDAWLRGPLRDWGESLLDPSRLRDEGFFAVEAIRARWDEHQAGARNWQHSLWVILMFQAWLERWR